MSNLEIIELVLFHCNIVSNHHKQDSIALYEFIPNKLFGRLPDISSEKFILLKIFVSEFSDAEVWFTDQNSKPLEIERKIRNILVIN